MARSFVLVHHQDQWLRCGYRDVAFDTSRTAIELAWEHDERSVTEDGPFAVSTAGLAFDPGCRLYHARPELGSVERMAFDAAAGRSVADSVVSIIVAPDDGTRGEFLIIGGKKTALARVHMLIGLSRKTRDPAKLARAPPLPLCTHGVRAVLDQRYPVFLA